MTVAAPRMSLAEQGEIAFGPYRLDRARRLLTREGATVALGDRAFEILVVLIRHAPEVVSKAAILDHVWPGVAIEDSTLRFHLSALRKALGDGQNGNRYIATASGKGYCFVAPVSKPVAVPDEPVRAAKPPTTNLPLPLTEIIGREAELTELAAWLRDSRQVTLTGPGGVGKTRLAVELGWRVRDDFPAGVWLVDLAPLNDRDAVPRAAAAALGVSVTSGEGAVDAIIAALGKAKLFMILDNCEHLSEAAAILAKTLLERACGVSILATSQRNLGLAAERVYGLDPLAVPPAGVAEVADFAAAELFIQRVRASDRLFAPHDGNSVGIGEICRQLDGLPLALEMAAAQVHMLGIEILRQGLGDRLKLLRGAPDNDARHVSLQAVLSWSHDLLSPFEQAMFRRLAVFPASFTLEAAIAVAGADGAERWAVVNAFGRLVDHSLVKLERVEPARYRLLESMRVYALGKLQEVEGTDAAALRHAQYFIEVFDEAASRWEETPDVEWFSRYRPEFDNLVAALDWSLAEPERRQIAIALVAFGSALLLRWHVVEARKCYDRVIPLLDDDTPTATAARLLHNASGFFLMLSDPRGEAFAERSAHLCRDLGDALGLAKASLILAIYASHQALFGKANALLSTAKDMIARSSAKKTRIRYLISAASYFVLNNDLAQSRKYYFEALELIKVVGSQEAPVVLINISSVEYMLGNIDRAINLVYEALSYSDTAFLDFRRAAFSINLGAYLIADGKFDEARRVIKEGMSIHLQRRTHPGLSSLQVCAVLAGCEGHLIEAARLIGFVDTERARQGYVVGPQERRLYDHLMGLLDAGLSRAERDAAKAEGGRWSKVEAEDFVTTRILSDSEPVML